MPYILHEILVAWRIPSHHSNHENGKSWAILLGPQPHREAERASSCMHRSLAQLNILLFFGGWFQIRQWIVILTHLYEIVERHTGTRWQQLLHEYPVSGAMACMIILAQCSSYQSERYSVHPNCPGQQLRKGLHDAVICLLKPIEARLLIGKHGAQACPDPRDLRPQPGMVAVAPLERKKKKKKRKIIVEFCI